MDDLRSSLGEEGEEERWGHMRLVQPGLKTKLTVFFLELESPSVMCILCHSLSKNLQGHWMDIMGMGHGTHTGMELTKRSTPIPTLLRSATLGS